MSVHEDLEGATDWSEGEPAAPSLTGGPQHLSQDLPGLGVLGVCVCGKAPGTWDLFGLPSAG